MRLSIGNFPALATHTLVLLAGLSISRVKKAGPEPSKPFNLPRNRSLISLPAYLETAGNGQVFVKDQLLTLVMVSRNSSQSPCIYSPAMLRHVSSKPHWRVQIQNKDLPELAEIFKHKHRNFRILPAFQTSTLSRCRKAPEVTYGSF